MHTVRRTVIGGAALLMGLGIAPQSRTYASGAHKMANKTILTTEVGGKYVFKPATTTIARTTRVTFKNTSDVPHTVTSKTAAWKYDKQITSGKTLVVIFRHKGVFKYFCKYHPGMVGKITVK